MTLKTRKPTGLPSWPILLLAGREGAGKSWSAVAASASPLVDRALYIGIGEDDPDEYALIPDADFEIVEHAGTFDGILNAVREAVAEPQGDHPTLLIIDSATRLWNLIADNAQAIANGRAKGRRNATTGDYTISADLWNAAAAQWHRFMDVIRAHRGPVVITARLDPVTVMNDDGQPTKEKDWKIQAHKSLPFDAAAIVEMRERGDYRITKVKSARVQLDKPKPYPEFTVAGLWDRLGLANGTGERGHASLTADAAGTVTKKPTDKERVANALAAGEKTTSLEELDAWWQNVVTSRLQGIPELTAAHNAHKERLAGTKAPEGDAWATLDVPV